MSNRTVDEILGCRPGSDDAEPTTRAKPRPIEEVAALVRAAMNKQGIGDACDDEQIRKLVEQAAADHPDAGLKELTEYFCDYLNDWMMQEHDPMLAPHVPIEKQVYLGTMTINWAW